MVKRHPSRFLFLLPVLLTGFYVLVDLILDHETQDGYFKWPHLIAGVVVLLLSGFFFALSLRARERADVTLRRAHEVLEARVGERTAQLEQANDQLRAEMAERRRAEQVLRNSEEKFARVFDFSPVVLVLLRVAGSTVLDVNPAFTRVLGHPREKVIGRTWQELNVVAAADAARLAEQVAAQGRAADLELTLATCDGGQAVVLASLVPLTINDEPCLLFIAHDITERKRSEEALQQAQAEVERSIEARAALEERQRLSRELHDSVSQALYGVSLGIQTAKVHLATEPEQALRALDYALALARAGLAELRALIFELRPDALESLGLVASLTQRAEVLQTRHDLEIGLRLCEEPAAPLRVKEAFYRIAQEALQNAVKHAEARRIDISLTCEQERLTLEVCDNGVGFDPLAEFPGHLGLRTMRERAEAVGGELHIVSAADCGTQIRAVAPLSPPA